MKWWFCWFIFEFPAKIIVPENQLPSPRASDCAHTWSPLDSAPSKTLCMVFLNFMSTLNFRNFQLPMVAFGPTSFQKISSEHIICSVIKKIHFRNTKMVNLLLASPCWNWGIGFEYFHIFSFNCSQNTYWVELLVRHLIYKIRTLLKRVESDVSQTSHLLEKHYAEFMFIRASTFNIFKA